MDHDRLFKELLTTFFYEFLELFFPTLAARVDRSQPIDFLDKESFGELPWDSRLEMDLVARLRLIDTEAHFIAHLEHEAHSRHPLPERMFVYFSRAWERYRLPVYPIVLFSMGSREARPQGFQVVCHDLEVLQFRYATVELGRLDWKGFLAQPNPVASALMSRMDIATNERPRVKLECLRMLANLRLEPGRSRLISRFVDSYLNLDEDEVRIFRESLENIPLGERQVIMEVTTSWKEEGRIEGREEGLKVGQREGLSQGLATALRCRFGQNAAVLLLRLPEMELASLERLREQLEAGLELEQLDV